MIPFRHQAIYPMIIHTHPIVAYKKKILVAKQLQTNTHSYTSTQMLYPKIFASEYKYYSYKFQPSLPF